MLEVAPRRKETTYPELSGEGGRARLVVLAAEVGGRWNSETAQFLTALARARAQEVPLVLHGWAEAAWVRWSAILACTAARAFSRQSSSWRLWGCCPFRPRGLEGGPFFLSTGVCFS